MKRKADDGIALLSMYMDDDDESEEEKSPNAPPIDPIALSETTPETVLPETTASEPVVAEAVSQENGSSLTMDRVLAEFLPPPPDSRCSEELQNKLMRYVALKEAGRSFNEELRNSKGYRNPDFLQHAMLYQGVDQYGTCFKSEVFNPKGFPPEDFISVISAEQKRVYDKRDQEMKENQRLEFVRAQGQAAPMVDPRAAAAAAAAAQIMQRAGAAAAAAATATGKTEGRVRKSKWDKVDGDTNKAVTIAAATAQASLLSQSQKRKSRS